MEEQFSQTACFKICLEKLTYYETAKGNWWNITNYLVKNMQETSACPNSLMLSWLGQKMWESQEKLLEGKSNYFLALITREINSQGYAPVM